MRYETATEQNNKRVSDPKSKQVLSEQLLKPAPEGGVQGIAKRKEGLSSGWVGVANERLSRYALVSTTTPVYARS